MADASMFGLDFFFLDAAILVRDFDNLAVDVRSYHEPLKRSVQRVVAPSIGTNFDTEGHGLWPELAPETIDNKAFYGFGSMGMVQRTERLKKAAMQLNVWEISRDEASIRQLPERVAEYGYIQNEGGYAGNGAFIPSRQFLMIQAEDVDKIVEEFDTWLGERLTAHGF